MSYQYSICHPDQFELECPEEILSAEEERQKARKYPWKDELLKLECISFGCTRGKGATPFSQTYFHGTKAGLEVGTLVEPGFNSNYGQRKNAKFIFLSATLDAALLLPNKKGHPFG